jgi:exopolysaccharide biosynthesis polyprenyl glycosylphosphotransferase
MRVGFTTVVVVGHALVIVASALIASSLRYSAGTEARWNEFFANPWSALAGYVVLALLIFQWSGLYRFDERWTMQSELRDSLKAVGILAVVTLVLLYLFKLEQVSRLFLAVFFVLVWAGITLTTVGVRSFYSKRRAEGKGNRHILIVGTNPSVLPTIKDLVSNHPELGIEVEGYLGTASDLVPGIDYIGSIETFSAVLQERVIDEVIMAPNQNELEHLDAMVQIAQEQGKTVRIPLPTMGYAISTGHIETVDNVPMLTVSSGPKRTIAFATKRLVDLIGSTLALIILAPVMLIVALVISIKDGAPVLYVGRRAGIHGRPIAVHKFRTMVLDANDMRGELAELNDRDGPAFKIDDDPRVTRTGRFLRTTSLDELPQFWDVFVGRMSLVGPRPQPLDEVAGYDAWHRRRLSVKPGVTGLWQVEARQDPSFETRARLDLEYIDNWSPGLDAKIMLQTIPAVLKSTGT